MRGARQYQSLVEKLKGHPDAAALAVGGQWEAVGQLERELLKQWGLTADGSLVDVGCGSGRLTGPMADFLEGPYLGTDVVPELLEHARSLGRDGWRYEAVDGPVIPAEDASADMVCFFSVITHLMHEDSYRYFAEAKRVLRPGGRIVASFLEFLHPGHWPIFRDHVDNAGPDDPLVVFCDRVGIEAWAQDLGLTTVAMIDGWVPHIPIEQPITFADGTVAEGLARLGQVGQSVVVLEKP